MLDQRTCVCARKHATLGSMKMLASCLDFAINFPSIVDEVVKRINKLPFIFYTHPKSYYEIPEDFIKFEDMPTIPKAPNVQLSSRDIAKLHDYLKKRLEVVRVRSDTTKHKFSTLHISLYGAEAPESVHLTRHISVVVHRYSQAEESRIL